MFNYQFIKASQLECENLKFLERYVDSVKIL
jgi:hypothetical protein